MSNVSLVAQAANRSDTVLWDYEFTMVVYDDTDITFEVKWNEAETVSYTTEQSPAIVHRDGAIRRIVFERLDLREVQCARASAQGTTFPSPVAPNIEVVEPLTIDNAHDSIAANLASYFAALLGPSKIATWPIEIRCFYAYVLSGVTISMPVVLVARQDVTIADASLFEQIESSVRQWLDAAQPPMTEARLSLEITVWSTIAGLDTQLLKIADASLRMTAPLSLRA